MSYSWPASYTSRFVGACFQYPTVKALPDMFGAFQFVDHRNGIILNRNITVAGRVYQKLVASRRNFPVGCQPFISAEGER